MDATQRALLRLYLADKAGTDEVLHDQDLDALWADNDEDLNATAADGWRMKAAKVVDWYAANIDGAFLSRQQVWEHCMAMAEHFEKMSGASLINVQMDSGYDTTPEPAEF